MITKGGRYFTGEKTYWFSCPEKSGRVDDIEAAVKAYDNEGRVFKGPIVKLTPAQVALATRDTRGHQEVIAEMIREIYEQGCAIELLLEQKVKDEGPKGQSEAGQDCGHVEDAAIEGPGDAVADGQDPS